MVRVVVMVGLLVAFSFAGCIGSEPLGLESQTGSEQEQFESIDVSTEMPERRFEPDVILDTMEYQIPQGSNPVMEFYVTDLKDYPFPVTFIDWAVFHDRNPNPVAEGDATQLPGSFNQTLYAKGFHMFGFRVDDTQGLNETRILTLEVGEDHEQEMPSPFQIAHFKWRIDSYFGDAGAEPTPPVGEVLPTKAEVEQIFAASWLMDNPYCYAAAAGRGPGVNFGTLVPLHGQTGLNSNWMDVDPGTWGQDYFAEFSSTSAVLLPAHVQWVEGSTVLETHADTDSGEFYEIRDKVPEGATRAYFFSCTGVPTMAQVDYSTPPAA